MHSEESGATIILINKLRLRGRALAGDKKRLKWMSGGERRRVRFPREKSKRLATKRKTTHNSQRTKPEPNPVSVSARPKRDKRAMHQFIAQIDNATSYCACSRSCAPPVYSQGRNEIQVKAFAFLFHSSLVYGACSVHVLPMQRAGPGAVAMLRSSNIKSIISTA